MQRHSDHHSNASRPYQALRDFEDLPRLPSGYPGCFGLAMFPSAWFKVMDAKLLEWCGGDLNKLNVDPKHRAKLFARYGVTDRALVERGVPAAEPVWTVADVSAAVDTEGGLDEAAMDVAVLNTLAARNQARRGTHARK